MKTIGWEVGMHPLEQYLTDVRYADRNFTHAGQQLVGQATNLRRKIGKHQHKANCVMYVPDEARFSRLLELPEGAELDFYQTAKQYYRYLFERTA